MRTKVGTVLESAIVQQLKAQAVKEGKTISEVIQAALLGYFHGAPREAAVRLAAVKRLCSRPFKLTAKQVEQLQREDIYEQ